MVLICPYDECHYDTLLLIVSGLGANKCKKKVFMQWE